MSAVPKATDAVRHVFPTAAAGAALPLIPCTTDEFVVALRRELAAVLGMACILVPTVSDRVPEWASFVRSDGLALGCDLPMALAAALVSHRCGGTLTGEHGAEASASVVRLHGILCAAAVRAAGLAWPASGEWAAGALPATAHRFNLDLAIGDTGFELGFAIALPAAAAAPQANWADAMRRRLEATVLPVRAVLHEAALPLTRAAALRPGDVLPIETPRDICLRVGRFAVARGTVAADDAGGHLVTIQGAARRGVRSPEEDA